MSVVITMVTVNIFALILMEVTVVLVRMDTVYVAGTALVHNTYNVIHTNQFLYLVDINECDTGTSGCEQICTNQVPFFSCSCTSGYRLYNKKFCSGELL